MSILVVCTTILNILRGTNLRLRDCIIKENELIDYALKLGHEIVAITDHESVSNSVKVEKYYNKIKKDHPNFKVILGNEIYLCRNGLNGQNFIPKRDRYYHFILLAKDTIGHKQIREISTRAWQRSYMSRGMRRVPTYYQDLFDIIGENPGHVIASTACLGGCLPTQILRAQQDNSLVPKIYNWIKQINELFGQGNFFLEMQPSNNKDQITVNKQLYLLSKELNIPFIITTDSHYLTKEDRPIHKAYLNSQNGEREVDDFYATTYMMDTSELESYFSYFDYSILQEAYQNILNIKNMCEDYSFEKPLNIPRLKWKNSEEHQINKEYWISKISYLKTFWESNFEGDWKLADKIVLKLESNEKLRTKEIFDEVNDNLRIVKISSDVNKTHWSAYFLNLQNIIDLVWEAGSLVGPGRGS